MADSQLLDLVTPPACIAGQSSMIVLITRSRTDPLQISASSRWGHRQHPFPKRSLKCSVCSRKAAWYTICIRPVQQWVSHVRLIINKQCTSKTGRLEGPWDDVMRVIGQAHSLLHENGVVRIQSDIRVGSRTDKKQTAEDKVAAVKAILDKDEQA
jgi:uncharacterized protein (TIGR00106 family)